MVGRTAEQVEGGMDRRTDGWMGGDLPTRRKGREGPRHMKSQPLRRTGQQMRAIKRLDGWLYVG